MDEFEAKLNKINGNDGPVEPTDPTVGQQFMAAMEKFTRARIQQMQTAGVNPAQVAMGMSTTSLQLEVLVNLMIAKGLITLPEFQAAGTAVALKAADVLSKPSILVATGKPN